MSIFRRLFSGNRRNNHSESAEVSRLLGVGPNDRPSGLREYYTVADCINRRY